MLFIEVFRNSTGTIIRLIVMSSVIIVFTEVVLKAIIIAQPEKIALISISILKVLLKILESINLFFRLCCKSYLFSFSYRS